MAAHGMEMHEAVVAEGGAQMQVQHKALRLEGGSVFLGRIKPGLAYLCLRVAGQPFIQRKGKIRRVFHLMGMPRVHTEARGHGGLCRYAGPVLLGNGAQAAAAGIGVMSMVIFHNGRKPFSAKL